MAGAAGGEISHASKPISNSRRSREGKDWVGPALRETRRLACSISMKGWWLLCVLLATVWEDQLLPSSLHLFRPLHLSTTLASRSFPSSSFLCSAQPQSGTIAFSASNPYPAVPVSYRVDFPCTVPSGQAAAADPAAATTPTTLASDLGCPWARVGGASTVPAVVVTSQQSKYVCAPLPSAPDSPACCNNATRCIAPGVTRLRVSTCTTRACGIQGHLHCPVLLYPRSLTRSLAPFAPSHTPRHRSAHPHASLLSQSRPTAKIAFRR